MSEIIEINKKTINIDFNNNNFNKNIYLLDIQKKNNNTEIIVNTKHKCENNIHLLITNNANKKKIVFLLNHTNFSKMKVYIYCLTNNSAKTTINLQSCVHKKACNTIFEQNINGLIFDHNSTIEILPAMQIENNKVLASHTANIGYLNNEILFYMMTKGIRNNIAKKILINSYINIFDEKAKKEPKIHKRLLNIINLITNGI
jgi:hypothetical protein